MKVRELIERLQTMEQDATVTVRIANPNFVYRGRLVKTREIRIDGIEQHGSGVMSTVRLDPEDELELA